MAKKKPFQLQPGPEVFRPTTALGRSLPAAIFWSLILVSYAGPELEKLFLFSWMQSLVSPWILMAGAAAFGVITPMWSGLAIAYSIGCRNHDGVRWTFFALNAASIVAWIVLVGRLLWPLIHSP